MTVTDERRIPPRQTKLGWGIRFLEQPNSGSRKGGPSASESDFKDKLKEIFAAPHTLNVVHSILAQVRS